MKKTRIAFLALLVALIAVAPQGRALATKQPSVSARGATGEIIVKLKATSSLLALARQSGQLMTLARAAGDKGDSARAIEPLARFSVNPKLEEIISRRGLDRLFVMKFDASADLDSVITSLISSGEVEYAEPNYRVAIGSIVPNDPEFQTQWPLQNLGFHVQEFPATPNADIKATAAWEITTGSEGVIVAVTDTGLDRTHPDLARNVYTNAGEVPGNNIDDDRNGYVDDVHGYNVADDNPDTSDIVGHGTQMSGIIAAEINNGLGISGVSQSKIMPVRFFRKDGPLPEQYNATVADAARSLLYSIAAGADVINASWRTILDPGQNTPQESLALQEAVAATNDAGVLFVAIAGNDGYNLDYSKVYPASYNLSNQITVAASDFNDEIWHPPFDPYFINTGFGPNSVDLAAPGVSVVTTAARGDCLQCSKSEIPSEWYARSDGTSISAAYVSGVAALVKSRYPNDSAVMIKRRITEGAEVVPFLHGYVIGGRRLSALGALTIEIKVTPPVLDRIKYKQGSGKLNLFGSGIKENAQVIVGAKMYTPKVKSDDFSILLVRVPASEFPVGTPVPIIIRNQDGGQSQTLFYTR